MKTIIFILTISLLFSCKVHKYVVTENNGKHIKCEDLKNGKVWIIKKRDLKKDINLYPVNDTITPQDVFKDERFDGTPPIPKQ